MTLQQLVGMILKNVKKYASQQADSDIKDAVFTVPAHWGFKARMALVNAAAIGELNALGLINENTAAAIHFAITRNDSEPINIGFFNLGSHNLQIAIVSQPSLRSSSSEPPTTREKQSKASGCCHMSQCPT